MSLNDAVRYRILDLCEQHNLTVYQLSKRSGIPRSTLQSIMDGKSGSPELRNIKRAADGFSMTVRDFFDSELFV